MITEIIHRTHGHAGVISERDERPPVHRLTLRGVVCIDRYSPCNRIGPATGPGTETVIGVSQNKQLAAAG